MAASVASCVHLPANFLQENSTGLAAAAVFAGTREAGITYLTLIPIAGGVVVASGGEPLFHLLGFVACLLATSGRALKSVVQVSTAEERASTWHLQQT
jgi:hypothetical protein